MGPVFVQGPQGGHEKIGERFALENYEKYTETTKQIKYTENNKTDKIYGKQQTDKNTNGKDTTKKGGPVSHVLAGLTPPARSVAHS